MNPAIAVGVQLTRPVGLDGLLGFVGLPSRRKTREHLSKMAGEVFAGVSAMVDTYLLRAIEARTAAEFVKVREAVFGDYARLLMSLARLLSVIVSQRTIEVLSGESFCELEAEFREHGLIRFGMAARDQALFTIWTLRRINGLISKIAQTGQIADELRQRDAELAAEFSSFVAWTQFHLDCLLAAIRSDKSIQPEVLDKILDGLRAVVNAYGFARQGIVLRRTEAEPLIISAAWDDEDKELLDSSMRDMEVESL